jgi:poly(3-hydroxyalkanoate) synthetase
VNIESETLGVWAEPWVRWRRFAEQTWLRRRPEPTWHTANRVRAEDAAHRLRDFGGTAAAGELPLLIVPPEVNHSAIVDFGPGQSLVRTALDAGFARVAAVEWRSATAETANRDIDDSIATIQAAIRTLGGRVHLVGLCQGGWESAVVAALDPSAVATLTLVAAPIDFHAGHGAIRRVAQLTPLPVYEALVRAGGGVMRGEFITVGFDNLLPFERYVLKPLSIWNRLDDEPWLARFQRLEDWYKSHKDLPGVQYLRVVRELFQQNRLIQGTFVAQGREVDLGRIDMPLALVVGTKDHITPREQLFALRDHARSDRVLPVELPAGHIGTFMGTEALRDHWPGILRWLRESGKAPTC